MEIVHISAECYPVAKAGGLGDVVGALPRYQQEAGHVAKVVMPMYRTRFLYENQWTVVHKGGASLGSTWFEYTVIKETSNKLGFDLYLVDVHGLLDREKVYGYDDDDERFLSFQIAVTDWLSNWGHQPDIVHVHDHHTGLIPFMMQHCFAYRKLASVPVVLTIHNAQYQGAMSWNKSINIPAWDSWKRGLLEWEGQINPLASAIKCAWRVTTVSQSYLQEMRVSSNGLEALLEYEKGKCSGILNGIDSVVWDPSSDPVLDRPYKTRDVASGKQAAKSELCSVFDLDPDKPLFVFIGRLVGEKAADLLPDVISDSFEHMGRRMNFLVLGSGEFDVESRLNALKPMSAGDYGLYLGYNEKLAHRMYAGADFLLMPSRVEPCGLNQTVIDIGDDKGYGITHVHATVGDITHAIFRSLGLYEHTAELHRVRQRMMKLDFSWDRSAQSYTDLYKTLK
jgi:starch synthase